MATIIYKDPWSPSDINCNWKPEKLSRYSLISNLIDFDDYTEGYCQRDQTIEENSETNLTGFISVSSNTNYLFVCEQSVDKGLLYCAYFSDTSTYLQTFTPLPIPGSFLQYNIKTPSNCKYIRLTIYKQAWKKCKLNLKTYSFVTKEKDKTPLNIVDNKAGVQIYKDLHFEVYVKEEAQIKNFVDCFDLGAFQTFPYDDYEVQNSLFFNVATQNYYGAKYTFNEFVANHVYSVGDLVAVDEGYLSSISGKYACIKIHNSADTFSKDYYGTSNWKKLETSGGGWLFINRNIKEKNYSQLEFPYVGSLTFKNLWGCDMLNYLNTYVNQSYLAISYYYSFAKNKRTNYYYYDKFFERGYFSDTIASGSYEVEGFGVRLLRGESFKSDEILGDTALNNYFNWLEYRHAISSDWSWPSDYINIEYFNYGITNPFDHYYQFTPYIGIPFFKEKTFDDFIVELILERTDILGNTFQRIVDLPISVTFTNNLIKCYHRNSNLLNRMYNSEYLNSNSVNSFVYSGTSGFDGSISVWCPDIKKLSLSSTISNPKRVKEIPTLKNINGGDTLYGQVGLLYWTAESLDVGEKIRAVHVLEYSDGANYDKFVFIQEVTRTA